MKVVHVNNIASVGDSLCRVQSERLGYHVKLINIIPKQDKFNLSNKLFSSLNRFLLVIKARKLIADFKPDIVHVHYSTSALWMIGVKAKIVVHAHGSDIRLKEHDYLRKIINTIGIWWANGLIYSTPELRSYGLKYKNSCKYLPNPVDMSIFKKNISNNTGGEIKILLHATPSAVKGFHISSVAILDIISKHNNVYVTMFSNEQSRDFVESNALQRVNLVNASSRIEIAELISNHDVFIGQFVIGSYGMSELEVMSSGKPLICNARNNLSINSSAPHMQAETSYQIIGQFEKIYNFSSADLDKIGCESIKWIKINHDLNLIVEVLDSYYREILSNN